MEAAINAALRRLLQPAPADKLALWVAQLGGVMPPDPKPVRPSGKCNRGHELHDLAIDHLGRCRRCVSEGYRQPAA